MARRQWLPWGLDDAPSNTVGQLLSITGCGEVATWSSTQEDMELIVPTSGKFTNLWARTTALTGAGSTRQIALRKNSVDSALALTFDNSNLYLHSNKQVSVVEYDKLCLSSIPTTSPTAQIFYGGLEFIPDNPNETIMIGSSGDVSVANTNGYLNPAAQANRSSTESQVWVVVTNHRGGQFGNITKMSIKLSAVPGAGQSRTFEVYKNSAGTGLSVTISGASSNQGNATGSIAISDGDTLSIRSTSSGSATATKVYIGLVIEPDVVGEYLICSSSGGALNTSGGTYEYNFPSTGNGTWTATKADRYMGGNWNHFVTGLGMKLDRSPSTIADSKAYEIYLENPSAGGSRAYVEGLATYAKSSQFNWGLKKFGTHNLRHLAFNSPRVCNASWTMQMRYVGDENVTK